MNIVSKLMKKRNGSKEKTFAAINAKSFITVVAVLTVALAVCGAMSYLIPQGSFKRGADGAIIPGTYQEGEIVGIEIWRVITAPFRVFASDDALTIVMICLFLLVMSGVFNLLEKTGGIKIFIGKLLSRLRGKEITLVCVTVLVMMLFGSFFGMFEELVTLLPIVTLFMLSIGLDTMTGLGACMLAACFGFSAAITNPFSVGLAAEIAGVPIASGVWLRIVFFAVTYAVLCAFLAVHLKKIKADPKSSPSYESDLAKRETLGEYDDENNENDAKAFKIYSAFFIIEAIILLLIASIRAISGLAVPILAASFLIFGTAAGLAVCDKKSDVFRYIAKGAMSMLPAVLMIALASSVKLVMTESLIMDTVMDRIISLLEGKNPCVAVVLIYALILFLQFFIGSASAKIILVMPIVMPVAMSLGLSPSLVILAYCMADGFTDVILPTNPVLLIGLSMADVSYGKWVRWTWKLQLAILGLTFITLFFGVAIGY